MIKGLDCFDTPTAVQLSRMVDEDFKVIGQYYGTPTSPKVLTHQEAQRISKAGLRIFSVFERTEGRPLEGKKAGKEDGELALKQAAAAGQPEGTTIVFAVDKDVDVSVAKNRNAILGYFEAVQEALGDKYRVGGYGGGLVLQTLLDADLIEVSWLAGAMGWKGSREFDKEQKWDMKQYPPTKVGHPDNKVGFEYDLNDIQNLDDLGTWSLNDEQKEDPVPEEKKEEQPDQPVEEPAAQFEVPEGSKTGIIDIFDLQRRLAAPPRHYYRGDIDGISGDLTEGALRKYSRDHRPPEE